MSDTIAEALRTNRPHKVTLILDDERELKLAIPRGTRKWERLAQTIAAQSWTEVRLFNKAGELKTSVARDAAEDDAPAAPELEDITGTHADQLVNVALVERLIRVNTDAIVRGFTEVIKVSRASGSAEVTAALAANREAVSTIAATCEDLRGQLELERQRTSELEAELAARMVADDERAKEPAPQTATDRLIDQLASGFVDGAAGAGGAAKANGHNRKEGTS